jgi:hypothetical protein
MDPADFQSEGGLMDLPEFAEEADMSYKDMLVTLPQMTRKLWINYARKAKRVDVKRLKEDMWRKLANDDTVFIFSFFVA